MAERGQTTRERILETAQSLVLAKGFAATSIDDILKAAEVTKGAFFHHFRSKAELARTLVERFAENDFAVFDEWERRSNALADDPYQALLIYIKLFEEWQENLTEPFAGCLFAVYVYESRVFEEDVNDFISISFRRWQNYYEKKLDEVIKSRPPKIEVTAAELAETMVSMLEGAFILARSHREPEIITRQSRMFRTYLKLLFE